MVGQALRYLSIIPIVFFVGVSLIISLKGCVISYWAPPKAPQAFSIVGADAREMLFTIYPDRRALIVYGDPSKEAFEAVLVRLGGGTYGTHYFGPVWNVSEGAESLLGLRWVSDGGEPVRFKVEVLNKLRVGYGDSAFSPIGSIHETVHYFRKNGFEYSGMRLVGVEYDAETFDPIRDALIKP